MDTVPAVDELGERLRRRPMRDVSHRFRRQPHFWTSRPLVVLTIGLAAALLALAARPGAHRSRLPARAGAATVLPATLQDPAPPTRSGRAVEPAPVFQIQVASFLDARNAARMVEQFRGEGLPAETRVAEGREVRYRVLATPDDAEDTEPLLERLRSFGFSPEMLNGRVAVTGFVSTEAADEAASRLEDEGISVRVEEERRTVSYHVVRVGAYPTAEAAERARVELAARGLVGLVVRGQAHDR